MVGQIRPGGDCVRVGGNCLKYLKRGWNRKAGRETKIVKGGQAGSSGGCLKKGGAGTPLRTMHTFSTDEKNANAIADLLQPLGFAIHPAETVLVPTQEFEFLSFASNYMKIKIKLTDHLAGKIISKIKKQLYEEKHHPRPELLLNYTDG